MLNKHHSLADGCSLTVICSLVVWMLVAVCQVAYGKDVYPKQAVEIAKKYITLSRDVKAQARAKGLRPAALAPYYIYNDAQGKGFVVVAGDDDMCDDPNTLTRYSNFHRDCSHNSTFFHHQARGW